MAGLTVFGVFTYNGRVLSLVPISDTAHQAVSFRLRFLCEGIYQYRAAMGHWPAKTADLAGTPMALTMRYWDDDINSGRVVVLWPRDWPLSPQDNANRVLAYYTSGLISKFGKQWVCWGDLRTEYLPTANLQALLRPATALTGNIKKSNLETRH